MAEKYPVFISAGLAAVLYLNTLWAGFAYDDSRAILKNQDLLPETPWSDILANDFWGTPLTHSGSHKSYRPLCVATFRLNYYFHQFNPMGYHLANLLMHVTVTAIYTYLIQILLPNCSTSLFAGLLFAAHPIHTEAVAGVVGRADIGACLFFLLALLSYVRFCRDRDKSSLIRRVMTLSITGLFAGASLLWKEQGVTVIAVCAVYDVFVVCKLSPFHLHHILTGARYRGTLIGLVCLATSGTLMILLRIYMMGLTTPEFSPADNPASDSPSLVVRTLTYVHLPCVNFWLLLCPSRLSFDWSMESIPLLSVCDLRNLTTAVFYTALIYTALFILRNLSTVDRTLTQTNGSSVLLQKIISAKKDRLAKRRNSNSSTESSDDELGGGARPTAISVLILSTALIVFPFLPASNLFFYVGFVIAERVLYIPSLGFCLLVGHGFSAVLRKYDRVCWRAAFLVLLISFSVRTVSRNQDWLTEERLYRSGIDVNPAKAWGNLANIYNANGRTQEAETAYRSALQHRGNMADVHYNLGILLQEQKRYKEAVESYIMAINCRPRLTMAHLNLGIVYGILGRLTEAEQTYRHCSEIDISGLKEPRLHESTKISALFNLGRLLSDNDRAQEAVVVYQEAIRRRPQHYSPQSLYNMLGEAYVKLERLTEAEQWYYEALRAKPDHIPAHLTLAKLYQKKGRIDEADRWFIKALVLDKTEVNTYIHYAQYLMEVGRLQEAADKYLSAAKLSPDDFELIFNAANAFRQAGANEESENFYRRAVVLRPNEASAHMNLGAMLHFNGKLLEAEKSYRQALHLKPNDAMTQENLAKLQRLMRTTPDRKPES